MQSFVDRFRAKASKARQAQSRIKALERMKPIAAIVEDAVAAFNFPEPEELSPPIIRLEDVSIGYGDRTVLKGLDLRIDQDDRIALLGQNGQGKSTLSKLLADRLEPQAGRKIASSRLRVGYFAQHQVDELELDETPLQHLQRLRPEETPAKLRARLAAGGIGADIATTEVRRLSGGQKARLSLLLATLEAPHLIILDEPTNDLDVETLSSLEDALLEFPGCAVVISHDRWFLDRIATHILAFEGDSKVVWCEGNFQVYEEQRRARLGAEADQPHRLKFKKM